MPTIHTSPSIMAADQSQAPVEDPTQFPQQQRPFKDLKSYLGPERYEKFQQLICNSITHQIRKTGQKSKKALRNIRNAAEGRPLEV